ncbi:hypothetical protein PHLCEN_2v11652 [Hermanssonia centrifuga]|uniref:Uncharacterized protein n=1 Tax=Hermanssonia centrifuga TaxID=98765 RepID=A0A2R6NJE7_9APHY|nr:hypothetical protein PHLCEN_2v11652 [Hermanssonia centrifuga]
MHRLRDLAEEVYADLEAHPEVPRTPAPCLLFDLGTMKLLARIRAAALPSGPVINIEDTPPISPIEDDVPLSLETEIGSHADVAREIRDMHQNMAIAIRSMHEDISISKLDLGVLVQTCDRNLALARAHTTHLGKIQGVVHDVAGGVDMLQGAVHNLENSERRVRELEGRLRGSARENEQLREERGDVQALEFLGGVKKHKNAVHKQAQFIPRQASTLNNFPPTPEYQDEPAEDTQESGGDETVSAAVESTHYHSILNAVPCDQDGNPVPKDAPPASSGAQNNDWKSFSSRIAFELGKFLYKEEQMSQWKINKLLELWAASLLECGGTPPFTSQQHMYDTIDAIKMGDVPWTMFSLKYSDKVPDGVMVMGVRGQKNKE